MLAHAHYHVTKFLALLRDECHYMATFTCEGGRIELTMKKADDDTASACLRYVDQVNANEARKKAMDDL